MRDSSTDAEPATALDRLCPSVPVLDLLPLTLHASRRPFCACSIGSMSRPRRMHPRPMRLTLDIEESRRFRQT